MAATVDPVNLSSLMQAQLLPLQSLGASGTEVTMAQMCDAMATAIAAEVNATIVASYTAHFHDYVGAGTGSSEQETSTPQLPPPPP